MKNKNIFQWLCFCFLVLPLSIVAQTTRITYPINGMVFQQNANGTANIPLSVHVSGVDATNPDYTTFGYAYYIERLDMQTGQPIPNYPQITQFNIKPTLQANYFKMVSETISGLQKGWYRITFGPNYNSFIAICSQVVFGVGDVYILAGQSNASGYGGLNLNENNPTDLTGDERGSLQSFTNSGIVQHEAVRGMFSNTTSLFNTNITGLPFGKINTSFNITGFQRLNNGSLGNPQGIYPNGRDSWSWVPFANKIASTGTPVMLFNVAVPNTIMRNWAANDDTNIPNENKPYYQKMRSMLQTFGRATGIRAILWQQGENDTKFYAEKKAANQASTYLTDYGTGLDNLIKWSRKAITGSETNTSLSWFVAKTSFNTTVGNINWSGDPLSTALSSTCIALRKDDGVNYTFPNKITSTDIRTKQQSTLGSVFQGIDSDVWAECYRSTYQRVHFSGNAKGSTNTDEDGLMKMANGWYDVIFNANGTYKNTSVQNNMVLGNAILPLIVTDNTPTNGSDGNYRLTAPSGYSKYFWVKDNQGIYDVAVSSSNVKDISSITQSPEYWTCYVSNAGDNSVVDGWDLPDLQVTQTFISRNTDDAILRGLRISTNNISYPANSIDQQVTVISNSVVWDVISKPAWTSTNTNLGGFGETPLRITTQTNSTGSQRVGSITLRDRGNIIADQSLTITQSATSGCSNTNLSSLTPTNPPNEQSGWGSMHNNQSVEGNSLRVSGYQTTNGIGTHAGSRLVYNLGGQYSTFSGAVGRDDEADGCGCGTMKVRFKIFLDNSTTPVFDSGLLGTTDNKVPFLVNVSGKNTLELKVEDGGDQIWGDHADWLDAVLSCSGGGGSCSVQVATDPTKNPNTPVNPSTQVVLSSSCPVGTIKWSTGQNSNQITVSPSTSTTYYVWCENGVGCSSNQKSVIVSVNTGGCSISDNLVMGTWTVTNQSLVARFFNGSYWLTQRTGTSPDAFVVRGANMLQRGDVTLNNATYYNMTTCFAWNNSNYGGLLAPDSQTFPTPSNYTLYYSTDGTPYYVQNTTQPPSCTNTNLISNWSYASADFNPPPKINAKTNGSTPIQINNVNFAKGIGTHAFSEIIYNLGNSHNFANFKASVGRDQGSYGCNCGGQTITFKVVNNSTGAVIGGPYTKGIWQSATDITVPISGVSSLKLVVEDGGDQNWGDWADWANARLECPTNEARTRNDSPEINEESNNYTIFPNPANDKLMIAFNVKNASKVSFKIIDLKGSVKQEYSFEAPEGNHQFEIDLQEFSVGSYFLNGVIENKLKIKRFVIER